ncbi:MAG: TonB family protein [Acidiferrobacterales bacterium]
MTVAYASYHSPYLPWAVSEDEKRRLRKILLWVFIFCFLWSIVVPFLPLPELDREKAETVPPRLAKLVLERKKAAERPAPAKAPKLTAKKKPKLKKAKPKKVKKKAIETARKKASRTGLLAFKDELAALRDNPVLEGLKKNNRLQRGEGQKAASPERSVITANASSASGGINTSTLSRDTGGTGLVGRVSTKVSSPVDGVGGVKQARASRSGARKPSRSIEEIQLVFDRNKAAIYSIYNRALRKDPTLEGKVVLKITIQSSGQVTACEIVSSELNDPTLERKIVARVRLFDFGAKEVETMVVTYPIDFLPS